MSDIVPAVELRHVGKLFGGAVALDDVSLSIRKGEFLSLLGPSGCGKSTTLNLIGGFEEATQGEVLINGTSAGGMPPHERPVNTVFQSYALFPHMTVGENVEFGLRMKGAPSGRRRQAMLEMLHMVSLDGYANRKPSQLSGGQRQRVALARALVNQPSVLLLDEPLGALDLKLRKHMQTELIRLQRMVGITFVYVTHDQEEALAMSDRIAVMDRGRLLQIDAPDAIYERPMSRFVMDFMGSTNDLAGRTTMQANGHCRVDLFGLGPMLGVAMASFAEGEAVALLVRPEKVRLTAATPNDNALKGEIVRVTRLGFVTHFAVRVANGETVLAYRLNEGTNASAESFCEGGVVFVGWDPSDAKIFPAEPESRATGNLMD